MDNHNTVSGHYTNTKHFMDCNIKTVNVICTFSDCTIICTQTGRSPIFSVSFSFVQSILLKLVTIKINQLSLCKHFMNSMQTCNSVTFYFMKKQIFLVWIPWNLSFCYIHLYWSIHTKDESKRGTAFAFIFGVNWLWHCGVTASFGVFFFS